jgi:hypothetical protein
VGVILAYAIAIVVLLAMMGPTVGRIFEYAVTEDDRVEIGDELYILSNFTFFHMNVSIWAMMMDRRFTSIVARAYLRNAKTCIIFSPLNF